MFDSDNIARYIPKKYWKDIHTIETKLDFDNSTFRNKQRYYIYFLDGSVISECGIKNLKAKIKEKYMKE